MSNLTASSTETVDDESNSLPVEGDTETVAETESDALGAVDEPQELSPDVIFEVLKNERRRRVIEYLRSNEGPAKLGPVAEHIAALENDKEESLITYAERKRVYVGLYQCHLPKMDDMGVVDFNRARGRIEMTDQTLELVPYIEGPVSRRQWHQYYGATLLGGISLYGAAIAGIAPAVLTPVIALGATLLALTVCTAWHFVDEQVDEVPWPSLS